MQAEATPTENAQPLVCILNHDEGLNDWLGSHPPSRLGASPALNNGLVTPPIWVLDLKTVDELAELTPNANINPAFIKATNMAREAAAKVDTIQQDEEIPTKSNGKSLIKSKKQCRTEVQDNFHDQIILMSADDPLWGQGRWTLLVRPQNINETFSALAISLATGELKRHGSIIALRARTLPPSESFVDSKKKGSPVRKGSSRSPTSSHPIGDIPLGIDIFFRPVWNSTAARDVLRVVAGACGKMPAFCKSSLYSRLGIRNDHPLGVHASLYNSKILTSPADTKQWIDKYAPLVAKGEGSSSFKMAESTKSADAVAASETPKQEAGEPVAVAMVKRELEPGSPDNIDGKSEEPAQKKARNGDSTTHEQAAVMVEESEPETQESPDEPMLPTRPTKKAADAAPSGASASLDAITHEELKKLDTSATAPQVKPEEVSQSIEPAALAIAAGHRPMEEESQTQIESSTAPMSNVLATEAATELPAPEMSQAKEQTVSAVPRDEAEITAAAPAADTEAESSLSKADGKVKEEETVDKPKEVVETSKSTTTEVEKPNERQSTITHHQASSNGEQVGPAAQAPEPTITNVALTSQTVEVVIPSPTQQAQESVASSENGDSNVNSAGQVEHPAETTTTSAASADVTLELKQPNADIKTNLSVTAESKEVDSTQSSKSLFIDKAEPPVDKPAQPVAPKPAANEGEGTGNESQWFESNMIAAADAAESASANSNTDPVLEKVKKAEVVDNHPVEGKEADKEDMAAVLQASKSDSQLSTDNGKEMSLDELIVEGATTAGEAAVEAGNKAADEAADKAADGSASK
ncbi:uncharacterized protein UBRO_08164 [Ustilago bromivora]|uniref:Uncharacterized protein n=1 Tax=Ustilago bromivora TaxID=307758 RepID=A0A1K0GC06_9BASI|nr:uncharacterized protein UBRO_08164 [Ustilago bromivora]SYW76087.1 uncharacterized protein UBRO2_01158 [Ustilago bromivora]